MDVRVRAARRWGLLVVAALVGFACGGPQEPAEAGETCYRDADCKVGLVCVPNGDERTCSDDVAGLVSQVDRPPPDGGTLEDAATPPDGG